MDKSFYAIIGDDVAISSVEGARKYRHLMSELGVSINDSKSLIPSNDMKVAEIAKRLFLNGEEISPIPPRVLLESTKSLEGLIEFLQVLANRTGQFRSLSELEHNGILDLITSNQDYDTDKFQVILTCPLKDYNPLGPYSDLVAPLLQRITSRWNTSIATQTYLGEIERFIGEEAAKITALSPISLEAMGMSPMSLSAMGMKGGMPRPSANPISPLVTKYMATRKTELLQIFRASAYASTDFTNSSFTEGQTSSRGSRNTLTSKDLYDALLSGPDPYAPNEFMEKRRIRRKQAIDLLYRYYSKSKWKMV